MALLQAAFEQHPQAKHSLVQLGDLGTGSTSGSREAFKRARQYLDSFDVLYSLITGNHDLEGVEFDSDSDNLTAWSEEFQQSHYWARDVGPCVLFGLSTTRYRDNVLSHHEVHVDAAQLEWFEAALAAVAPDKPAVVFTHAPPLGCGLKVLNDLHIKNRCATASSCMHACAVHRESNSSHCMLPMHVQMSLYGHIYSMRLQRRQSVDGADAHG